MLAFAALAFQGSPLLKVTPRRSLNSQTVGWMTFHSVARAGTILPVESRSTRPSKMFLKSR